jgi:phosphocarrier protein
MKMEKDITVGVHCGIHGRVATELARLAGRTGTRLEIITRNRTADCASILEILALGISRGSRIQVRATGEEAGAVLARACSLLTGKGEEK